MVALGDIVVDKTCENCKKRFEVHVATEAEFVGGMGKNEKAKAIRDARPMAFLNLGRQWSPPRSTHFTVTEVGELTACIKTGTVLYESRFQAPTGTLLPLRSRMRAGARVVEGP